jgi:PTH1 family peptidyl-tRNA hydrolase
VKLVVGLGNPGPKYERTRHNIGFQVVDELLRRHGGSLRGKFKGEVASAQLGLEPVVLLKPMTFMNLSGESVGPACGFYGIDPEDVVVIHDELDLPFGRVKVKSKGGHGGHNGLRSLVKHIGADFARVRVGIGRPERGDVTGYVLTPFAPDEAPWVGGAVDTAADAVESIVREGVLAAMNRFNAEPG